MTIQPRVKVTPAAMPTVNVIYGTACENCGHRRRTEFVGLPADVAAMLRAAQERSGLSKADVARRAGLVVNNSYSNYFARLLEGTARPSKPVARELIAALSLTWPEGERLLAASGSERDRRHRGVCQ